MVDGNLHEFIFIPKSPSPHCRATALQVSLKNVGEARSVVAACKALLREKCDPRDIAVITPYKAQQHEIRARQALFQLVLRFSR